MTLLMSYLKGACLTEAQLNSLGFSGVLETPEANTEEGAKCSSEATLCISPSKIEEQIKSRLSKCKEKRNEQKKKKGERIKSEGKQMGEFVKGMKKDKGGKRGKKFPNEVSGDKDAVVDLINENCTESECQDLQKKMEDKTLYKDCFKAMGQLTAGAYCGLLGEKASEIAVVDSSGNIVNFNIDKASAVTVFETCVSFFQVECVMTSIYDLSEEVSTGKAPQKKGKGKRIQEACAKVPEINLCLDDPTKCNDDLKFEFISSFISLGKDCAPGEDDEDLEKGSEELKTLEGTEDNATEAKRLLAEFKARILEEEVTASCQISVTSNGYEAYTVGGSSGFDFDDYAESVFITISTLVVSFVSLVA